MIITFLLIILIIIVILLIKNKENFKNLLSYKDKDKHKYLNIKEASDVLRSVEELEEYNELDYKLRNINKENYDRTCDFYVEKLEKFSKHDKVVLDWVMKILHERTPNNLTFLYNNINFA